MGNRALVIFTDGERVSPVVYLHWHGDQIPDWLAELEAVMTGREGDVDYSCARFIGICSSRIGGNLSLGTWNTPSHIRVAVQNRARVEKARQTLTDYSHGNAGVVLVNARDFTWQAYGGYLALPAAQETVAA